jgi:CheY-like chemotaxis protein
MLPTEAASAAEALRLLVQPGKPPFDVGIIDFQMPDMDGLQLARAIRMEAPRAQFPLVLLTSIGYRWAPSGDQENIVAVLSKPVRRARLLRTLREVCLRTEDSLQSLGMQRL